MTTYTFASLTKGNTVRIVAATRAAALAKLFAAWGTINFALISTK